MIDNQAINLSQQPVYEDKRGKIQMILEKTSIGSISRITSFPNQSRALHYHPTDSHWILINEGQIHIYERHKDSKEKPIKKILNKNDLWFTHNNIVHEMWSLCYVIFDCYSLLPRNSENYEYETIRVDYSLREIYESWKD